MATNKKVVLIISLLIIILAGFGFWRWEAKQSTAPSELFFEETQNTIEKRLINDWEFPREEGEHQNMTKELWFFAGHLEEEGNPENRFGITLIFNKTPPFVLVNLTDGINQKNFSSVIPIDHYDILSQERLAVKKEENFWLEYELFKYKIYFEFEDGEIDLDLEPAKEPALGCKGENSFDYRQTRVKVTGKISFSKEEYKIKGFGWIEHQGFQASPSEKKFQWYAIQLDNNKEISFITDLVSKTEKFDRGDLLIFNGELPEMIEKNKRGDCGSIPEMVEEDDYSIENLDYWVDLETGYQYPVKFRLKIPAKNADLEITAIVNNQVIKGTKGFYAGSCKVSGFFEDKEVSGRAQFEILNPGLDYDHDESVDKNTDKE